MGPQKAYFGALTPKSPLVAIGYAMLKWFQHTEIALVEGY